MDFFRLKKRLLLEYAMALRLLLAIILTHLHLSDRFPQVAACICAFFYLKKRSFKSRYLENLDVTIRGRFVRISLIFESLIS
jgi:hypothetical protein